jgi:hypothetical protein
MWGVNHWTQAQLACPHLSGERGCAVLCWTAMCHKLCIAVDWLV